MILVFLQIPKLTPNPRIFPESVRHQNLGFCSRKWRFWLLCSQNDIYLSGGGVQTTLHNTEWRPSSSGRVGAGSGTIVIGVVSSGRHHAVDQLSARDLLPNVHDERCVINPTDTKAQSPALSPRHPYVDIRRRSNWACWFLRQRSHTLCRRTSTDATCYTNRAWLNFCGMLHCIL